MSIDITLRFRKPEEVVILLEIMALAVAEAEGAYSDNAEADDAITMGEYNELENALWACLKDQGFEVKVMGPNYNFELFYKGERLTYKREPSVAPVLKSVENDKPM
jgi:hypothetical protein